MILNSGRRSWWPLATVAGVTVAGVTLIAVAAVESSEVALDAVLLLIGRGGPPGGLPRVGGQRFAGHADLALPAAEMPHIYGPVTGPLWGNAMLSRYPILEWESVALPPEGLLFSRGYLWARLDLGDDQQLRVVTTHLHHIREDADVRAQQAQELLDFWGSDDRTVIMGDFNARKDDPEAQMIRDAGLTDVVAIEGIEPGYTVPSEDPKYQIDYIWLSPDLTAEEVAIPVSEASDHMPVVATVLLR